MTGSSIFPWTTGLQRLLVVDLLGSSLLLYICNYKGLLGVMWKAAQREEKTKWDMWAGVASMRNFISSLICNPMAILTEWVHHITNYNVLNDNRRYLRYHCIDTFFWQENTSMHHDYFLFLSIHAWSSLLENWVHSLQMDHLHKSLLPLKISALHCLNDKSLTYMNCIFSFRIPNFPN